MGLQKCAGYESDLEFHGRGNAKSFKYLDTAKELWDSTKTAYAQKRNDAKVLK